MGPYFPQRSGSLDFYEKSTLSGCWQLLLFKTTTRTHSGGPSERFCGLTPAIPQPPNSHPSKPGARDSLLGAFERSQWGFSIGDGTRMRGLGKEKARGPKAKPKEMHMALTALYRLVPSLGTIHVDLMSWTA